MFWTFQELSPFSPQILWFRYL